MRVFFATTSNQIPPAPPVDEQRGLVSREWPTPVTAGVGTGVVGGRVVDKLVGGGVDKMVGGGVDKMVGGGVGNLVGKGEGGGVVGEQLPNGALASELPNCPPCATTADP